MNNKSTKQQVVEESLSRVESRIKFLRSELFDNNPTKKLTDAHGKVASFFSDLKAGKVTVANNIDYITSLEKEVRKQERRRRSFDFGKLSFELMELEFEYQALKNELFLIKQK